MRTRVTQIRKYHWARPAVRVEAGEELRGAVYDRLLSAAVYPLPENERRTGDGILPWLGMKLVLPADCGLRAGDLLRPVLLPDHVFEVMEVRGYPAHREAVVYERLTDGAGEPCGTGGAA